MATYTLISSVTVGAGGASSITFSSIPATYTDLVVKFSLRDDTSFYAQNVKIVINSSSSGYSERAVYGTGSSATSANQSLTYNSLQYMPSATATASTFGNGEFYIPNYAGSNNKSYSVDSITENNATSAIAALTAGLWANSAAITSITLSAEVAGKTLQQYSTAYLYGISKS